MMIYFDIEDTVNGVPDVSIWGAWMNSHSQYESGKVMDRESLLRLCCDMLPFPPSFAIPIHTSLER